MKPKLPVHNRTYQNHHLDSSRWENFKVRDDDILVCTSMKSGTTWMQRIVSLLLFQNKPPAESFHDMSMWLDMRLAPLDETLEAIEAQTHRRFLKTHSPLNALPYFPEMKYIVIGRDVRDVFMSLWNHASNYTEGFIEALNNTPGRVGEEFPPLYDDIHGLWHDWINRGNFEWETDGYPFWSHLSFVQSWWDYRHLPNIYLVHFSDLLKDLEGEMRKVADFLDITVDEALWPSLVEQATFDNMKNNAVELLPGVDKIFAGGAKAFVNKGTNGRWRDVLTADELKESAAAVEHALSPDCARWLEEGGADKL